MDIILVVRSWADVLEPKKPKMAANFVSLIPRYGRSDVVWQPVTVQFSLMEENEEDC